MSANTYTPAELTRFRELQRLAYDVVEQVGDELEPGVTEREAAARIRALMAERGITQFFHAPFAWFGDRTAFRGIRTPLYFFPTDRRLEPGMPFILDVAPIDDGYSADIGFTSALGHHPVLAQMKRDLAFFRTQILELVRAEQTLGAIYAAVDRTIAELGYTNAHAKYPFHVLGHRVGKMPLRKLPSLRVGGFDVRTAGWLFGRQLGAMLPSRHATPLWNEGSLASSVRAEPGLWALEPHLAKDGVGAKWEEMLLVTETDAHWLDDDLPHVREWATATRAIDLASTTD